MPHRLRVVDEHLRDVPRDGVTRGEIVLRAPFLTPRDFTKPEASEELWAAGHRCGAVPMGKIEGREKPTRESRMPARSCVSSGIDTANATTEFLKMFMDSLVAGALVCGEWLAVRLSPWA